MGDAKHTMRINILVDEIKADDRRIKKGFSDAAKRVRKFGRKVATMKSDKEFEAFERRLNGTH